MSEGKWIRVEGFPAESLIQELERKDALIAELVEALKLWKVAANATYYNHADSRDALRGAKRMANKALSTAAKMGGKE